MSELIVRQLLEARLIAWADLQGFAVQTENTRLSPVPATLYLRCFLLPAPPLAPDLAGTLTLLRGVFQVDLCDRTDGGAAETGRALDLLRALFPTNLRLTASGIAVQQLAPLTAGIGLQIDGRYVVPASLTWRADPTP